MKGLSSGVRIPEAALFLCASVIWHFGFESSFLRFKTKFFLQFLIA